MIQWRTEQINQWGLLVLMAYILREVNCQWVTFVGAPAREGIGEKCMVLIFHKLLKPLDIRVGSVLSLSVWLLTDPV